MNRELPAPRFGDRALFPSLAPRAYLNHAGISPVSEPVRRAVSALLDDYAAHGAGAYPRWAAQRTRLRAALAALLGARPEDLALAPNTTRGVSDIALCFPWRTGDTVVLFEGEFPSNVVPWLRAAELYGLRPRFLPAPGPALADRGGLDGWLASLEAALREGARLVALSAVQFQTGYRAPLARVSELTRRYGAELFVDAVQAVGACPVDVRADGVDYLAAGSHKWLLGLEGAGVLYVAPERVAALRPHVAGWLSVEEPVKFLFEGEGHLRYDRPVRARADLFEGGNVSAASHAALEASVGLLSALGPAAIYAHAQRYHDALEAGLLARGFTSARAREPEARSCTLSVRPPAPAGATSAERAARLVAVHEALGARGVACARPDGWLRFAPHWPNALDEVPEVLDAVDEALAAG